MGVFLPLVPLKEHISGKLKINFGFTPYSERVNGRTAFLGLDYFWRACYRKSVITYHLLTIVFIQIYFVASVSTMLLEPQFDIQNFVESLG